MIQEVIILYVTLEWNVSCFGHFKKKVSKVNIIYLNSDQDDELMPEFLF